MPAWFFSMDTLARSEVADTQVASGHLVESVVAIGVEKRACGL